MGMGPGMHHYTFSKITSPSSTHVATYGNTTAATPPARGSGTEFATADADNDYLDIALGEDGLRAAHVCNADAKYPYHMFKWQIPLSWTDGEGKYHAEFGDHPDNIGRIFMDWTGRGARGNGVSGWDYHAHLFVWDPWDSVWVLGAEGEGSASDITLSVETGSQFWGYGPPSLPAGWKSRIMDGAGVVYVCAMCPLPANTGHAPVPDDPSIIRSDYLLARIAVPCGQIV